MLDTGPAFYLVTSAFVLAALSRCRKYWNNRSHPPLPPGPSSLPIVGSIFSLDDPFRHWFSFNAWKSTYGDIIYTRLLNKPVVVINSEEVAKDLFDFRSTIYSDRPQSIVYAARVTSWHIQHCFAVDFAMPFMAYGNRFSASFILSTVCDYEPKTKDDYIVHVMLWYIEQIATNLGIGVTMVIETFPFLLRLPTWLPGATFKRAAVECLQASHNVQEIPFQDVKERMMTSLQQQLRRLLAPHLETSGSLLIFLLAMVLHPEVQAKGQADIDRVVGKDRLPDFDDRPGLPYLDAILRETLRSQMVPRVSDGSLYLVTILSLSLMVFSGVPHSTTTSDIYNGYFIPKGLAMTHNEKKYPSPDEFKPERFLHEDGSLTSDTMHSAFGWGRRVWSVYACSVLKTAVSVGQHLADASLWIAITSFLATFSVNKALDEHGKDTPVVPKFSTGLTVFAECLAFFPSIIPRNFLAELSRDSKIHLWRG
ncbi:cytochrome P450 [Rhizopogon vinicolor AM-OR11-026]|uniref:Cytochrome P450 n=1 Tax=Rhizopogon vinicolor AM-OR11-026 TaxID=1314800 RepID=A0A1B7MML6_9AGAM|nr:cytochrome P450 [Rhizopogon vinicolor AM-OR11-026]